MEFCRNHYAKMYWNARKIGASITPSEDGSRLKGHMQRISHYLDRCGLKVPYIENPHNPAKDEKDEI